MLENGGRAGPQSGQFFIAQVEAGEFGNVFEFNLRFNAGLGF